MSRLWKLSTSERKANFEAMDARLKGIFATYPRPKSMDACPCCTSEEDIRRFNQGDMRPYLGSAMYTWGSEDDFKHYLPALLSFAFLEDPFVVYRDSLVNHLNYVKKWTQEEIEAIVLWFSSYSEFSYVEELRESILKVRSDVQAWLDGSSEELQCDFPFDEFEDFEDIRPFVHNEVVEELSKLLDVWPKDRIDFAAYASCLQRYQVFVNCEPGIFEKKLPAWIKRNAEVIEALFWETSNPKLQQLFSDALPPNVFPESFIRK